ncbi:hypothetical protein BDZ45DRAFT_112574 [Acephala macrosclerotiorum]|nr:hypothetical protein BDZ45DRAFT_112574 [Acephala macrosclerotiorum]
MKRNPSPRLLCYHHPDALKLQPYCLLHTKTSTFAAEGADQIFGKWQCVSALTFSDEACTQQLIEPMSLKPLGRVTFTPDGYMSAIITHPDCAAPTGKSWRSGASDEVVARVARAMSSYYGPYQVSQRDGETILSTNIEIALEPN